VRISAYRALLGVIGCVCVLVAGALAQSAPAAAEATPGPAPTPVPTGLPDGRVYEEVSPPDKNGNYVASGGVPVTEGDGFAVAEAGGDALVFLGSGAMGNASSSMLQPYVARRTPGLGWSTSSVAPAQVGTVSVGGGPNGLLISSNFQRFAFTSSAPYAPARGPVNADAFLSENPFAPATWLVKPSVPDTIPAAGENISSVNYFLAGGTPSLSTVYFIYAGTLTAQDAARAPYIGDGYTGLYSRTSAETAPWGFYEWTNGVLSDAGVLPDGTISPFGAMPAAFAGDSNFHMIGPEGGAGQASDFDNQVSEDGSRVFFVSPDPVVSTVSNRGFCESYGPCTSAAPELYVRETLAGGGKRTVLVSQSQLPGHVGEPAPTGPVSVAGALVSSQKVQDNQSDAYASADGSRVFFASPDRLTSQAPENTEVKKYEFDVESETLTYLPGVAGSIVAAARDGSDFLFVNGSKVELWRDTGGGGQVSEVAQLPAPAETRAPYGFGAINFEARASSDGSAFVFDTNAPIAGGFNNGGGYGEVYRYDVAANELVCVSCAPLGVEPTGNANISYDDAGGSNDKPRAEDDSRVISADGSRVFFDTPTPLVAQAINGKRDVYEWEAGKVYLISSGTSDEESFYLDNSESGNDVFFNTTAGLVPGDADDAYDAYDARVPRPGDNPPPTAVPCQGDVCQGPPSVPQLLGAPPSASFDGLGNVTPSEPPRSTTSKSKKRSKTKRKATAGKRSRVKGRAKRHAEAKRHAKAGRRSVAAVVRSRRAMSARQGQGKLERGGSR
jgi:hypothetical protein